MLLTGIGNNQLFPTFWFYSDSPAPKFRAFSCDTKDITPLSQTQI